MTADGPVPIKTIVIGHQQELLSTPAYPGANHDVNGYCIRHHKVRLSQPVLDESAKTGCVAEPIKKYKVIRKICPHCGVHQSAQRQFRAQGSGGSDRREVVNTFSNALVPKAVPRKNIRGSGIGGIATTDPSGGRNKHDVSNITHKSQHQNASGRSRAKGVREKDAVKTSLKAKDKATAKYKVKEGKTNAGMIRDGKKEKKRTNVKTREGDREKDALTTSLNAKDKFTEKGKVKERNKGDRLVRDGKKEKDISYVKSREKYTKPAGRDRAKDGCNEQVNNKKDGNSVDEGRTGDAAKEKGIRGRAEKKERSAERIIDADKGTRDRTDTKDSTAARQSGTLANHDHSPSHGYYDQHVDSVSGPGCITKKGGVYHIKKRANDDIPSARSPKVPKHAVQFTRGGSQELNSNSPLIRSVPFKTEEIKESTEDNDNESEQRATHVYMMAAGLLPLHNNYRNRDYEHEGNQLVKKRAENQDSADKEKERDNAIKDRVRERAVNSSAKVQPKKTPGNSSNGKSECNELFGNHDSKVPAYSIKETSNGNGKKDPKKIWESHNNINKETLLADHHKQDSNKLSEVKKDISIKIASDHISSKNKEYKGKQPLATSINEHDPGKGKIKAKGGGQSKASGSGDGDGNCAGNHAVNYNVRHGGKNKDRITGKETHGSNERGNHRHKARGRPPNTELHFRRGSSLDSRRSRGNSATGRNDHNEKGGSQTVRNGNVSRDRIRNKRIDYQRSKSLPQRQQRKRVPSEYHVAQQQPQYSTLSTSRQTFLDQMANMSIYVPNKTKPTERSASQVPASKNQRHDG